MSGLPRKRYLGPEQRRALQLLGSTPFGVNDTAMFVNGFTYEIIARLVRAGFATTERELKASGQTVGRVSITEAGRQALKGS